MIDFYIEAVQKSPWSVTRNSSFLRLLDKERSRLGAFPATEKVTQTIKELHTDLGNKFWWLLWILLLMKNQRLGLGTCVYMCECICMCPCSRFSRDHTALETLTVLLVWVLWKQPEAALGCVRHLHWEHGIAWSPVGETGARSVQRALYKRERGWLGLRQVLTQTHPRLWGFSVEVSNQPAFNPRLNRNCWSDTFLVYITAHFLLTNIPWRTSFPSFSAWIRSGKLRRREDWKGAPRSGGSAPGYSPWSWANTSSSSPTSIRASSS